MISRLEALADAIGHLQDFDNPKSRAYRLRNMGLLRNYSLTNPKPTDSEGYRQFESMIGGYRALLFDLTEKISGNSRAGIQKDGKFVKLQPESELRDLLRTFGVKIDGPIRKLCNFLNEAFSRDDILPTTPLKFFTEN